MNESRRLPAGRKAALVEAINLQGQVTVAALAEEFSVSIDTIRRDLDRLDSDGQIVRTHGGALSLTAVSRTTDRGLDVRLRVQAAEKERIGELAASMVSDGSVVMINAGTTALALARALRNHRDLTIATNNLQVPAEIMPTVFRDLYVFGGSVRSITQATTGPVSFNLGPGGSEIDLRCDVALIAVGAVSEDGYSTSNLGDAAMMADMMSRADRVIVMADSSKFERRLFAQVAPLSGADVLVTDTLPSQALQRALAEGGVELVVP
ncbi:DeoR/GlpR family DNA-binding transcription regulator [Herbiconiux ginsengi]|uniref:Lactose phosphotransferase system repressor n=1 Tax=Herbiconiux ginsengi TaxID=381665 RepID=A0A1H3RDM8_9MICO|nr:DeoR/GlpR family DNA-binding transcription regulator [Herbiconiux ginsengi]SDZ23787.1 transcriptional regulator, DeoR family [Herbiconiux ginsengi]